MGMATVCGFLTMSILPLILLIESTVAEVPQSAEEYKKILCEREILFNAVYLNDFDHVTGRKVRIIELFKGPRDLKGVIRMNTRVVPSCGGLPHAPDEKMFVEAEKRNGEIVCLRDLPWFGIFTEERKAVNMISKHGC